MIFDAASMDIFVAVELIRRFVIEILPFYLFTEAKLGLREGSFFFFSREGKQDTQVAQN
jgi:hypothetical protein